MKQDVTRAIKLTAADLEYISDRLRSIAFGNKEISSLAYQGVISNGPCGCKGSCEGGCTSW